MFSRHYSNKHLLQFNIYIFSQTLLAACILKITKFFFIEIQSLIEILLIVKFQSYILCRYLKFFYNVTNFN